MDNKQMATIKQRIFAIPGMKEFPGSIVVFGENSVRDTTHSHLTFMSDGCETDTHNGETFTAYMRAAGCPVDVRRARAMTVASDDLVRVFEA